MALLDGPVEVHRGEVGDFCWWPPPPYDDERVDAVLFIRLPNDYGPRPLPVTRSGESSNTPSPIWWWNGDREKPTLRASIYPHDSQGNGLWHGWLTDGELHDEPR